MKRGILLILVVAFTVALSTTPAEAIIGVEGRYWFTDLDGTVKSSEGALSGSDVDFVDDLALEDDDSFRGRITLELGSHRFRYSQEDFGWSGQSTLSRTVEFMGKSYTVGTAITSNLDLEYQRFSYDYALFDTLGNRVGFILEVKHFDLEARLQAPGLGFDEKESFDAYLPSIGLSVQVGLPVFLSFGAELTGIGIGGDAYLYDGEVMVNFSPFPLMTLSGGYRQLKIHVEDGEDQFDMTLKGPFVNLAVGF